MAEPSVHSALSSDLGLDVYPEIFDYETFVKASMSKTISTNQAIVILSDALSQRVVPLEAVIALVRKNVILIPWKSSEEEIAKLNVAACSPRPTPNTLRRTIFTHAGLADQPPRFDGDDYIEEPPDARVVDFSPQGQDLKYAPLEQSTQVEDRISDRSTSPLDWFSDPQKIEQVEIPNPSEVLESQFDETQSAEFKPQVDYEEIEEAEITNDVATETETEFRTQTTQADEPSFLPEFFGAAPTDSQVQTPEVQTPPTSGFWDESAAKHEPATETKYVEPVFETPATTSQPTVEVSAQTETPANSTWTVPTQNDATHPYAQTSSDESGLELEAYMRPEVEESIYDFDDSSTATFVPDVAFTAPDADGSQQMWTMLDSKVAANPLQESFSSYPDGTDNRKAISLAEPFVVCVYSPKGGVGKTSISVNLAARLAYTTRLQVCIVDLDIAFGNVGTRLGLYNPTVRELLNESHIDGESLARNLVYDRRSGLFSLLAPLRPETGVNRRKFSPAAYKKILNLLKERFDVVILDCPVELRDPLVSGFALPQADQVVMVVNNEQATLLDARRAVEAMCRPKDSQRLPGLGIEPSNVGLVVNQKVDNVGREVDDIKAILGGGDPNHPSKKIDILSVIADDRQLWVGNANMARTVATSGENDVDQLLDNIWTKILPGEASEEFESQEFHEGYQNPLDAILNPQTSQNKKKKRKFNFFKGD